MLNREVQFFAVERIWHKCDSQGLGAQVKVPQPFRLLPLCSEAVRDRAAADGARGRVEALALPLSLLLSLPLSPSLPLWG